MIDEKIQELKAAIAAENNAYTEFMRLGDAHREAQKVWRTAKEQLERRHNELNDEIYKSVGVLTPQQQYEREKSA